MKNLLFIPILIFSQGFTAKTQIQFYSAVFNKQQSFWVSSPYDSTTIGILPATIDQYKEDIPCDSCRWLSANGLQFSIENFFYHHGGKFNKSASIELIAPHNDLIREKEPNILTLLDTLQLPFEKWFDEYQDTLIIRDKDRFTPSALKLALSKIGGQLGKTHLLWPCHITLKIHPKRRNKAKGLLQLEFYLVFWNVTHSYPEWITFVKINSKKTNLNQTIDTLFQKPFLSYFRYLPEAIKLRLLEEPR